jgi:hypothetical protein
MKFCPECFEYVPSHVRECPVCFHSFRVETTPLKNLTVKAREGMEILSGNLPRTREIGIRSVSMFRVISKAGNECLKITYYPDNLIEPAINEFFVWSSDWGYKKAQKRLLELEAPLFSSCLAQSQAPIKRLPKSIVVDLSGKYPEVKKICT